MTTLEIKNLKVTKLRKVLKSIIIWDNGINRYTRAALIETVENYELPTHPKHFLFMRGLADFNKKNNI